MPTDFSHVERYPLTTDTAPTKPVPVALGCNWYTAFDNPVRDNRGRWWIGRDPNLGSIRGGHCVCLLPPGMRDPASWWGFYNQGMEGACFPAGTLIELVDGSHVPIEDVRTLQQVRTAEGNAGVVLQTSARFHAEGLITLRLRGHKHLRATPEHPILTASGYRPIDKLRIGDVVRLPGVLPEMRPAREQYITPAEWLSESEQRVRTTGIRWSGVQGRAEASATITSAPDRIELSRGFGRIVGLWLAEGSTTANKVAWHFGGHERNTLVPDLMDLLRNELGADPRLQVRGNGSLIVVIYGKHWRLLFERMLSLGPYDKTLPGELASGSPVFLEAVLQGWLDGDGHKRRGTWAGITVSHRLALAMYRIAQVLGKSPTISVSAPSTNRHAATRRMRWEVAIAEGAQAEVDDGGAWRKVVGLEHEEWAGYVHNLDVEGDHSYIAEGVGVHNCVGFGCSRMMSLLNRKRYDARWLWNRAKEVDEWPDTNPGDDNGTSVRAALDVLRTRGHVAYKAHDEDGPSVTEGISANRWATSVDDALAALGRQGQDAVPLVNSWGRSWPHVVWLPASVLERLRSEEGEIGIVVDR